MRRSRVLRGQHDVLRTQALRDGLRDLHRRHLQNLLLCAARIRARALLYKIHLAARCNCERCHLAC